MYVAVCGKTGTEEERENSASNLPNKSNVSVMRMSYLLIEEVSLRKLLFYT